MEINRTVRSADQLKPAPVEHVGKLLPVCSHTKYTFQFPTEDTSSHVLRRGRQVWFGSFHLVAQNICEVTKTWQPKKWRTKPDATLQFNGPKTAFLSVQQPDVSDIKKLLTSCNILEKMVNPKLVSNDEKKLKTFHDSLFSEPPADT